MKFEYPLGATPINPDEASGLIPAHLTLQRELNEYEEANIVEAVGWLFTRHRGDPLDAQFINEVHRHMFDHTWKWAGQARRSDKNIGVPWAEIPTHLHQMLGDVRAQIKYRSYTPFEIAARYHHRLVWVHVFPNGNGRHARLMADLLLSELTDQRFEWENRSLATDSERRDRYIKALQAADINDYRQLLNFLRIH